VNADRRRALAREPFEQKIQKVGQLSKLSENLKARREAEADQDTVDVAYLKHARVKKMHYRPLDDYLRERKRIS
jgi:hypothetical protein